MAVKLRVVWVVVVKMRSVGGFEFVDWNSHFVFILMLIKLYHRMR